MAVRYLHELLGLAALAAVVAWVQRAPGEPAARARYLCHPVHVASRAFLGWQAALSDRGRTVPAAQPGIDSLDSDCQTMVQIFLNSLNE